MKYQSENKPPFGPGEMISASELKDFLFCHLAWFLNQQGFPNTPKAATAFFLAAVILLLVYRRQRLHGGSPAGDLIYLDTAEQDVSVLVSERYGLKGKPDALVRTSSGDVIPVERKRSRAPHRPYPGDLIQATAYCVLVEETYGRTPPFMRIEYADRSFDEAYTLEGKSWVLQTCEQIRHARRTGVAHRSHTAPGRCRSCGQRPNCHEPL